MPVRGAWCGASPDLERGKINLVHLGRFCVISHLLTAISPRALIHLNLVAIAGKESSILLVW